MTMAMFWRKLKQLKKAGWKAINREGTIRLFKPRQPEWKTYCPITAVYFSETGKRVAPHQAGDVASKLGLRKKCASYVIGSADNNLTPHTGIRAKIIGALRFAS